MAIYPSPANKGATAFVHIHKYVVDWHIIHNLCQEVKLTVRKRSLYYWSKSYGETISEAETYESLKKTISINTMGYIEIKESGKIHTT